MLPGDPRQHIEGLYRELTANKRWCEDMSDVEKHSSTLLAHGLFFSELLQNGDDAGAKKIEYELAGSHLIVTHNGKHFAINDVEKIIRFANSTIVDKSQNANATGYKGIGFKALGSIAHKIYIFSAGYRFHFDQNHWRGAQKPWQMIPIWTEDQHIPADLTGRVKTSQSLPQPPVLFIFALRDRETIQSQLEDIPKNSADRFLFTRSIIEIRIGTERSKYTLQRNDGVHKQNEAFFRTIAINQQEKSKFMVYKYQGIAVPPNVLQEVQTLDSSICPERLKMAKSVVIEFAFPIDKDELTEIHSLKLYNTFPTEVQLGLPFIINAEFIVKADRQGLYPSGWNSFLIRQFLTSHFHILSLFGAHPHYWKKVLLMLAPSWLNINAISGLDHSFCQAYKEGFSQGLEQFPFIPSFRDPKELLKARGCLVDHTGFFAEFKDKVEIPPNLASSELEKIGKLDPLDGVNHYRGLNDIADELVKLCDNHRNPHLCFRVLLFISKKFPYDRSFENRRFILTSHHELSTLGPLSLPNKEMKVEIPPFVNLSLLHPEVLSFDKTGEVSNWLQRNRCLPITIHEILRKYIVPPLKNPATSQDDNIALVRFLFKLYQTREITQGDLAPFREIYAITRTRTLALVHTLYFYKAYDPFSMAEEMFGDQPGLFLTSIYVPDGEEAAEWSEFFRILGVKSECQLHLLDNTTVGELKNRGISKLSEFLSYLYSYPNPLIGRNAYDGDAYAHFIFFPHLECLVRSKQFSAYFWKSLNLEGRRWIEKDKVCQFRSATNRQSTLLPQKKTYLQYVLTSFRWILGTDQKFHTSAELYSPRLRSLGPTVDSEITIDEEAAKHLGFITTLTMQECLEQLTNMQVRKIRDLPLYTLLLEELIDHLPSLQVRNIHFLASDNSWQPVENLKYCPIDIDPSQEIAQFWFKNVLPQDKMCRLAHHFDRPVTTQIVDLAMIQDKKEDPVLRELLIQRSLYLVWRYAQFSDCEVEDVFLKIAHKLKKFQIFKAKRLPALDGKGSQKTLFYQNTLYYIHDWKSHKVAIIRLLGNYFEIGEKGIELLHEILELKDYTREGKYHTTIQQYIDEYQIQVEALQQLYGEFNFTYQAEVIVEQPIEIEKKTPKKRISLEGEAKVEEIIFPMQKLALDPVPNQPQEGVITKIPTPKEKKERRPKGSDWKPIISAKETKIEGAIAKINPPEKVVIALAKKEKAPGEKPKKVPLSDRAKAEIGRWGEEFGFRNLLCHYIAKGYALSEDSPNKKTLIRKEQMITLEWLNCFQESMKPQDMILTKSDGTEIYLEVKASKGKKTRFFLSENEMQFMQSHSLNYRLFFISNAGTDHAAMSKISKLNEWITGKLVQVKEHKKFEVIL